MAKPVPSTISSLLVYLSTTPSCVEVCSTGISYFGGDSVVVDVVGSPTYYTLILFQSLNDYYELVALAHQQERLLILLGLMNSGEYYRFDSFPVTKMPQSKSEATENTQPTSTGARRTETLHPLNNKYHWFYIQKIHKK